MDHLSIIKSYKLTPKFDKLFYAQINKAYEKRSEIIYTLIVYK